MIRAYLNAQFKRTAKLSAVVLPVSLLLFLCLGLAAALFLTRGPFSENRSRYGIAVVGNIGDSYLGFGIKAVQSLDDSRFVVDFDTMPMEEAEKALRRGEVAAIFVIPDDFLDSVLYGRNDAKITYITGDSQKTIGTLLIDQFARLASELIISSQAAVYGMQDLLISHNTDVTVFREISDNMYLELAGLVMTRTALTEVEELGFSDGTDTVSWYFHTILLFFCFLFGMSSAGVFLLRNPSLPRWMRIRGLSAAAQVLCEYLVYLLLALLCTMIPLWVLIRILENMKLGIVLPAFYEIFPALLPVLLLTSALQFFLYESVKSPVAVFLLQFFLAAGMGYLSGYFYPPGFFPASLRFIGQLLPTGVALSYLRGAVEDLPPAGAAVGIIVYAVLSIILSVHIRRRTIAMGGAL